ncbi:hypothetical protein AB0D67_28900 [Streptosporangium sp. NPDC048047]|uniref:hypothetical protein n=1 Tax=Streptosporangium sp. NPDC048047 TaxID=3155748 RepID=UPI003433CB31
MNVIEPTPVHAAACETASEHWCGRGACPVACSDPGCPVCHPEPPDSVVVFRTRPAATPGTQGDFGMRAASGTHASA